MVAIYLSLGSNVDPESNLLFAVEKFQRLFPDLRVSSIFQSPDRHALGPDFLNQVLGFSTELGYLELLDLCKKIETSRACREQGRCSLDIDILLYGDHLDPGKKLPHPDILSQAYILQPLTEIAAEVRHPLTGQSFLEHLLLSQAERQPDLPKPSATGFEHSKKFLSLIQERITEAGGAISFADYMQMTLYEPAYGYYVSGSKKFSEGGDFITAPDISPLFAKCIARQCQQIFSTLSHPNILEFGAGQGSLAAELLRELSRVDALPEKYFIVEPSPDLQERQQEYIAENVPELFKRCEWLKGLPKEFVGIILANEVVDAMPAHRFSYQQGNFQEYYVSTALQYQLRSIDNPVLLKKLEQLETKDWVEPYHSEINLAISPWIKDISQCLSKGVVLIIDYGFPRHEYYFSERSMGTLNCHYRHRSHDNVFWYPGLQDITAHVDFTAIAEAADAADLEVLGFTNQANFLLNCGLLDYVNNLPDLDPKKRLQQIREISKLTDIHEMGELFKVIALGRGMNMDLLGFARKDKVDSL